MGILEPSSAPYSNWWFTVPKKNGTLRFIQDLQPVNKVTIRNAGIGPTIDEFAEAFAGRSIYSVGDLYSGYDQFQLAVESRDITTMRTPLGLVRMCTLPQGGTNSVAHMVNAMNKVLRDCISDITMPFWTTSRSRDSRWRKRTRRSDRTVRGREAHLLWGKIGLRAIKDHGRWTPMRAVRPETVSG